MAQRTDTVTVSLAGDVMTGRGVDQILPHPGDPTLRETYVTDANTYVELAERANGPIPRPVDWSWVWGDALSLRGTTPPDVWILNLETSVTRSERFLLGKAVHYRMHPGNVPVLSAIRPDCLTLANNHVLDFGPEGLTDTLATLRRAALPATGAGRDVAAARQPVVVDLDGRGRVVVVAIGAECSGIPPRWAASDDRPGVAFLSDLCAGTSSRIDPTGGISGFLPSKRPGDILVVSVHWGSNWGYDVPHAHVQLAHSLVDAGVDVVHGHSSHHPRPIEVYRGRPILYGCGDLIDDYEGISGHEQYRADLRLLYRVTLTAHTGELRALSLYPFQVRRMRLHRASDADRLWLQHTLDLVGSPFDTHVSATVDGRLAVSWEGS